MDKQNQSSFQQRQERLAKQKLQNSVNTLCARRSWHDAQQFSYICTPAIDHLSRKDAQWLANKPYSDLTKVNVLLALGQEEKKNREITPDRRNKKIWGAATVTAGITTATIARSTQNIWPTFLMGLVTIGLLTKWAYHKGGYEGKHANQTLMHVRWLNMADKNPNFKHALTRLAPQLWNCKTKV